MFYMRGWGNNLHTILDPVEILQAWVSVKVNLLSRVESTYRTLVNFQFEMAFFMILNA
jgi:hypothetical protein